MRTCHAPLRPRSERLGPLSSNSATQSSSTGSSTSSWASMPTAMRWTLRKATVRRLASSLCERWILISVRSRSRKTTHSTEPPLVESMSRSRPLTMPWTNALTSLCASVSTWPPMAPRSSAFAALTADTTSSCKDGRPWMPCSSSYSSSSSASASRRLSTNMPKTRAKVSRCSMSAKRKTAGSPLSNNRVTQSSSSCGSCQPSGPSSPKWMDCTVSRAQVRAAAAPARRRLSAVTPASSCTRARVGRPPADSMWMSLPATISRTKPSMIFCAASPPPPSEAI
mmetsp:Transcript_110006/g.306552  ORF Transcript_110006/g.306552 Transcript_110006/m.306552 type:complete len:282 (-) Transcript_110006:85-930(-)